MSMKTEPDYHDTYETATHILPQIRECKNEDRTSLSVTGEGKGKDANMMVSYTHKDDSKNASDKCLEPIPGYKGNIDIIIKNGLRAPPWL